MIARSVKSDSGRGGAAGAARSVRQPRPSAESGSDSGAPVPTGANSKLKREKREQRAARLQQQLAASAATTSGSTTSAGNSSAPGMLAVLIVGADKVERIRDSMSSVGWWDKKMRVHRLVSSGGSSGTASLQALSAAASSSKAVKRAPDNGLRAIELNHPNSVAAIRACVASIQAGADAKATDSLLPAKLAAALRDGTVRLEPNFAPPPPPPSKISTKLSVAPVSTSAASDSTARSSSMEVRWLPKTSHVTVLPKTAVAPIEPSSVRPTLPTALLGKLCPGLHAFRYIELFAGIGGFRLALNALGGECVFSSEIDVHACNCYEANYGEVPSGDIRYIEAHDIPPHDLISAGFPCQPFSTIGRRAGFSDDRKGSERGQLFWHIIRIIDHHHPKAVLLENVPGLVTLEDGSALEIVCSAVSGAGRGYTVSWHIVDSGLLLPQARKRVYIIGIRNDIAKGTTVPLAAAPSAPAPAPSSAADAEADDAEEDEGDEGEDAEDGGDGLERKSDHKTPPPPVSFGSGTKPPAAKPAAPSARPLGLKHVQLQPPANWRITFPPFVPNLQRALREVLEPVSATTNALVLGETQWYRVRALANYREHPTRRVARLDVPGATLISSYRTSLLRHSQLVPHPLLPDSPLHAEPRPKLTSVGSAMSVLPPPRWLTGRECARMQGFPEWFRVTSIGARNFYRAIGNAVSPPAVAMVAGALMCAVEHGYDLSVSLLFILVSRFCGSDVSTQGCV